jgi:hypothetical protein
MTWWWWWCPGENDDGCGITLKTKLYRRGRAYEVKKKKKKSNGVFLIKGDQSVPFRFDTFWIDLIRQRSAEKVWNFCNKLKTSEIWMAEIATWISSGRVSFSHITQLFFTSFKIKIESKLCQNVPRAAGQWCNRFFLPSRNFLVITRTTGERLGIYNVCVLLITSK